MSERARKKMTVAEFLEWDDGTDTHYELIDGEIVAMASPTDFHGAIAGNIIKELGNRLKPPCRPISQAGIIRVDRDDTHFEADIAVNCAPLRRGPVADPLVVVEVLSPSTTDHDRGRKVPAYRTIPTIQEIVLVSAERRHVELWRREGEAWSVRDLIGEATMRLASVDVEIALAAIYAGTEL